MKRLEEQVHQVQRKMLGFGLSIRCPSIPGHWSMTAPDKQNSTVLVHESKWQSAAEWHQNALRSIRLDSTLLGTSSLFHSLSFSTRNGLLFSDEQTGLFCSEEVLPSLLCIACPALPGAALQQALHYAALYRHADVPTAGPALLPP